MAILMESPRSWDASVAWRRDAACKDLDPNLFFPIGVTGPAVDQIAAAKSICSGCPVRQQCLDFAITTNQEFGVWGGNTEDERRVLRRQWRAAVRRERAAQQAAAAAAS
jgi:WhiB family redox-sensing transcriptional regulator